MNGIRVRGLRTFAAVRNNAEKSKFLAPRIKQYLFDGESTFSSDENHAEGSIKLPRLSGKCIQSHVKEISEQQIGSYRNLLQGFSTANCPPVPSKWVFQPGWTCYRNGSDPKQVEYPDEEVLVFDAEVCVRRSFGPVLATAVSSSAWYCWVSPVLINCTDDLSRSVLINDLIPLGNQGEKPRVVIGHYVCFDSARVRESYDLPLTGLKFFDTMAAHISVSGITDVQRYFLLNAKTKPEWAELACGNSLSHLLLLYCNHALDKTGRDVFVHGSLSDIADKFQELTTYCALDVDATRRVFCKLLPLFLERFPHGATLSAMLEMSTMLVPVRGDFKGVVDSVKERSVSEDKEVSQLLQELATDALQLMKNDKFKDDPWMWDQDWSIVHRKNKQNALSHGNYPEWYRKLTSQVGKQSTTESDIHINFRRNIAAKLMQLCWGSFPLHYEYEHGWGMLIPAFKASEVKERNVPVESIKQLCNTMSPRPRISSIPSLREYISLQSGLSASNSSVSSGQYGFKEKSDHYTQMFIQNGLIFKKLPHYMSIEKNVGGALSIHLLMNPCLRSENIKAKKILKILRRNLFWKRNSKAFETLPIVWFDKELARGAVLTSISAMGDFTRNPREHLFSSLCNEASDSTGIEISQAFRAPPGWCFLSATIPQLDLWMACLLGDSVKGEYGATPIGQMFIEGSVYSSISNHMKLTELQSALLFHAVLWGANRRYLAKLLREINPLFGELRVFEKADELLEYLCGARTVPKSSSSIPGGILSDFLSRLGQLTRSKNIATPILQSRLSRVLESDSQKYFALIQNWLVRSSVADYLHVLMLCFRDQMQSARLCSAGSHNMHVKYLVPESEKYCAAKALHMAHLHAAAFCTAQVGLKDVPKVAAELPFVTISSNIREEVSTDSQKLTFDEAIMHPQSDHSQTI